MRGLTYVLALFLLIGTQTYAQSKIEKKAFYIHSLLGINSPGFDELNQSLERNGFQAAPSVYFSRGGGYYAFFRNTRLVQLTTFSTYSGSRSTGDQRTWARGTQVSAAIGIDLRQRTRLQAIPYAGVAYSILGLRVNKVAGGSQDVGGYLSGPANHLELSLNQWMGNLGLHLGASPVGKRGFAQKLDLAVRGGYYIPLNQGDWKTGERQFSSGPEINSGGFYGGVVLGIRQ